MVRNREKSTDLSNQQRLNGEDSVTYWLWRVKKRERENGYVSYLLLHCKHPNLSGLQNSIYLALRYAWEMAALDWLYSCPCIHLAGCCELILLNLTGLFHVSGDLAWI